MLRALVSQPLVVGGKQQLVIPAPHTSRRRPGQVAISCRAAACGRAWRCLRDAARYGRCSAHVCRVAMLDARAGAACEEPEERVGGHEASGVVLEQEIARLSRLIGQLASAGGTVEQARSALPAAVPALFRALPALPACQRLRSCCCNAAVLVQPTVVTLQESQSTCRTTCHWRERACLQGAHPARKPASTVTLCYNAVFSWWTTGFCVSDRLLVRRWRCCEATSARVPTSMAAGKAPHLHCAAESLARSAPAKSAYTVSVESLSTPPVQR